jgi:hypothetical protein
MHIICLNSDVLSLDISALAWKNSLSPNLGWRECEFVMTGADMDRLSEITKALGALTPAALVALVMLAGFGLAAFAIYAVLKATGKL